MTGSQVNYSVDGVMTRDQIFNGASFLPPPDAIQEFKVQTSNMDAQQGLEGAMVTVQLKSGTNSFHGDAFEFLRNDALDSRNFFSPQVPVLKQNQFGFTLGGPIRKNKTFFFGDYQGTRIVPGTTENSVVPSVAMRNGDFSGLAPITDPTTGLPFPGNQIDPSRFSPQALFFLKYIEPPNTAGGTYVYSPPAPESVNQFDVKIDHQISAKDSFTSSYSLFHLYSYTPGPFPQVGGYNSEARSQRAGAGWVHTFGPTSINELRAGYNRLIQPSTQQGAGTNYTSEAGIQGLDVLDALYPGFPAVSISGFTAIPNNFWKPIRTVDDTMMLSDTVTLIRGKHTIRAGGVARWNKQTSWNSAYSRGSFNFNGTYTGNPFADYLIGDIYSGSRGFPKSLWGGNSDSQVFFISDEWKLTPKLTLTLGAEYALLHPMTFIRNAAASYDPTTNILTVASNAAGQIDTTAQLAETYVLPLVSNLIETSKQAGWPASLRYIKYDDFAPRLGLAWSPARDWAVRLGYGITHTLEEGNMNVSDYVYCPPFVGDETARYNDGTKTFANLFPPLVIGQYNAAAFGFEEFDPHRLDPYIQQWNVTLQKLYRQVVSFEVAYVGNKATHLPFSNGVNVPLPGPGSIQARRLRTDFGEGGLLTDSGNSIYHALQAKMETRSWHALNFLASYTYSRTISSSPTQEDPAGVVSAQDPLNPQLERGVTNFDIPSRFTLGAVYELPFLKKSQNRAARLALGGWRMTSIFTSQSGYPFTPSMEVDSANTGTSVRPNRIGSGILANPTIQHWFDVSAFAVPAQYTFGDCANNILRSPLTSDWDFGLFKNFSLQRFLGEGSHVEFRSEFFNFTNHPNFGTPVTDVQSSAAGRILSAGTPREIQFALKVVF